MRVNPTTPTLHGVIHAADYQDIREAVKIMRRLISALTFMFVAAVAVSQPAQTRYVVYLTEDAMYDASSIQRDIGVICNASIDSQMIPGGFVVLMNPAHLRTLQSDRRVRQVIEAPRKQDAPLGTGDLIWNYSYDGAGNISSMGAKCVAQTDCDMQLTITSANNRIFNASYDVAGNVLALPNGSTFTYDGASMLTSDDTTNAQHIYTADNERIATYANGTWTWTIRDLANNPLREFTSHDVTTQNGISYGTTSLSWQRDHVWRGTALLAAEARTSPSSSTITTEHFHLDHLGTPRLVTNGNGGKIGYHSYYPFGGELDQNLFETPEAKTKFTGHIRDTGRTGGLSLDYMHARSFSASIGRFLSVDSVIGMKSATRSPQLWNRYSYVRNNPVRFTDPTGAYVCSGSKDQCKAFAAALLIVRAATFEAARQGQPGVTGLKSVLSLYGKEGVDNGVAVKVTATALPGSTGSASVDGQKTTLTIDPGYLNNIVRTGHGYFDLAKTAAHEGDHALKFLADPSLTRTTSRTDFEFLERSAWRTENYINAAFGISDSAASIWMSGSGWTPVGLEATAVSNAAADCTLISGGCTP